MTARYDEMLDQTSGGVAQIANWIFDRAVSQAMVGAWAEWSDAQKAGTTTEISPQSLLESGDPNVVALVELAIAARTATETLQKKKGKKPSVTALKVVK